MGTQPRMAAAPSPEAIFQLGLGFWGSKTLLSGVELGLFTELAKGPLTADDVTARLNLHPRAARDFLDALVALNMLERTDGHYSNTPATDQFLDRAKPSYMGGLLEMVNTRLYRFWGSLTDALRSGKPQNEVRSGEDLFAALYADPDRLRLFLSGMTGLSAATARAIARQFPWHEYDTFADIGTAQGGFPVSLATEHRHLKGIGYDLPAVKPVFEEYVESAGLAGRIRFEAGDFMKEPLARADVIVMGHILHDWDLEEKRMLVRKAHEALPAGGAFIAFDAVIDDERRSNAFGLLMSLNMLIETHGGFDYTGADCMGWMREAGFRQTRVERLSGPDSMVIGIK